ncbi:MAG: hypothetical protein QOE72_4352 [Chloroflexota bacterium]|nr:hypothetical protein [Chloroflexota bacterium]
MTRGVRSGAGGDSIEAKTMVLKARCRPGPRCTRIPTQFPERPRSPALNRRREKQVEDTLVADKDKDQKRHEKTEHKAPDPEHNGHTPAPGDPHYQGMPKK